MEGGKGGEKKIKFMAASLHTLSPSPLSFSLSLSLSVLFSRMGYHSIQNGAQSFKLGSARMN